jgi:D-arabinose 1-dehydrogenase-like Zn-dependent alcohol dehydrogenase
MKPDTIAGDGIADRAAAAPRHGPEHESPVKTRAGVGNVELVDVLEPACPPEGVKIRVAFTDICGTDLHVYRDTFRSYPPVILGHEFSGLAVEVGDEIRGVPTPPAESGRRYNTGLR